MTHVQDEIGEHNPPQPIPVLTAQEVEGLSMGSQSFGSLAWRRFRRHKLALLGAIGLILIALAFFIGPMFSEY